MVWVKTLFNMQNQDGFCTIQKLIINNNAAVIYERKYPRTAEKAQKKNRIIILVITQLQRQLLS